MKKIILTILLVMACCVVCFCLGIIYEQESSDTASQARADRILIQKIQDKQDNILELESKLNTCVWQVETLMTTNLNGLVTEVEYIP